MIRSSTTTWHGPGQTGEGRLTAESNKLLASPFNFRGRFSTETDNINPEELIAAAHAIDFVMKLSFVLGEAGFVASSLTTTAHINFVNGSITDSHLVLFAVIPGIDRCSFDACVKEAELTCPVSRALKVKITTEAKLEE